MYYYFDVKLLQNEAKFFYKKTHKYDFKKIKIWKENINLIIKSKKSIPHLLREKDFVEKLGLKLITDIKITKEKIEFFKNSNLLFYKIQSREPIQMKFKSKEILLSKEFYIKGRYVKYVILKIWKEKNKS